MVALYFFIDIPRYLHYTDRHPNNNHGLTESINTQAQLRTKHGRNLTIHFI